MRECSCICVSLISARHVSTGLNRPNDRLPAGVDIDVLDRDLLLAFAPVAVQGFQQGPVSPGLARAGMATDKPYGARGAHAEARDLWGCAAEVNRLAQAAHPPAAAAGQ